MRARIPLDVDLEDKLIYGLSPLRFAYVLVAGVAAMAIGRHPVLDLEVAETRGRAGLEVAEAARDADIALLVTPADVPLESLRKVAGALKPPRELVLVINRAPPGREWTELLDAAGAQRAVALPFDPWLAEAERKGEPAFNPILRGLAAELVRSP